MTWGDFVCLPWTKVSVVTDSDRITSMMVAGDYGHRFECISERPTDEYKAAHPNARTIEHYVVDTTVFKTRKALLAAIADIDTANSSTH